MPAIKGYFFGKNKLICSAKNENYLQFNTIFSTSQAFFSYSNGEKKVTNEAILNTHVQQHEYLYSQVQKENHFKRAIIDFKRMFPT